MNEISKVSLTGPLAAWRNPLTAEFTRLGYATSTIARHLQLIEHLSGWMAERRVEVGDLSWANIKAFCKTRGMSRVRRVAPLPLVVLMRVCRPNCAPPKPVAAGGALPVATEALLESFDAYLHGERALAGRTSSLYLYQLRRFAQWFVPRFGPDLTVMTVSDVERYRLNQDCARATVRSATIALRALCRWMFLAGQTTEDLSVAISTVKDTSGSDLPKALPASDIDALFAATKSMRDTAILLLLTRLGLRANEVAALKLDDFDWRAGTVRIRGKGNDVSLMPVPAEVGDAIAAYLTDERPADSPYREVFLGTYTPRAPLSRSAVSVMVGYLAARGGVSGPVGAHRLRHSAATAVLAGGGTLIEAGQLLRHRSAAATMIYARTDVSHLAEIARPWPQAGTSEEGSHA